MTNAQALPEHYVVGKGEVSVFMLHGAYGSGEYFRNTAEYLANRGYRVVVWDAPGYGKRPGPPEFTIGLAGDAARELVLAEATEVNIVFGHSMGCLIALDAVMKLGSRVDGLVLSAASPGFNNRTPEEQERFLAERLKPITEGGLTVPEYVQSLLAVMMAPGASGPLVDNVVEVVKGMRTETFVKSIRAIMTHDPSEAVDAVVAPTLLIAGEHDTATPPEGMETLHARIPGSEYQLIEGTGHYAFAEDEHAFHAILLDFLGRKFPVL